MSILRPLLATLLLLLPTVPAVAAETASTGSVQVIGPELVNVNRTHLYHASALNETGWPAWPNLTWSAPAGSFEVLSDDGAFVLYTTPLVAGDVVLTATSEDGVSGTLVVTVVDVREVVVRHDQADDTLNVGQQAAFSAVAYDADGNVLDVPLRFFADRGTIGADGTYTARRAGTDTVFASFDGAAGSATIEVSDDLATTLVLEAETYAALDGLDEVRGAFSAFLLDGTAPTKAGVLVKVEQLEAGRVLRGTHFSVPLGADGTVAFTLPQGYNLPGSYRVTASVYDGGNAGASVATYTVGL